MIKKNNYITILTVIACIGVVVLHGGGYYHSYKFDTTWKVTLLYQTLFYPAVAVFYMVSGATLLNYRERYSTAEYINKRIPVVLAFLVWSIIYWLYGCLRNGSSFNLFDFFQKLLNGGITSIFWFFYPLFYIYIAIPIFSLVCNQEHRKLIKWLIIILMMSFCLPNLANVLFGFKVLIPSIGYGWFFFALLGWYFNTFDINAKIKWSIIGLGLLGAVMKFSVTLLLSDSTHGVYPLFNTYKSFSNVFMAMSWFLLAKGINWDFIFNSKVLKTVIIEISNLAFSIYLVQQFGMDLTFKLLRVTTGYRIFLAPILLFCICYVTSKLISFVPWFGRILIGKHL